MPANHADPNATLSPPPPGPVFVDASGRRLRRIRVLGLGVLGLAAGYVILLLLAFLGGPNAAAPFLPLGIPQAVPAAQPANHRPTPAATPLSNGGPLQASERQSGAAPGVLGAAAAAAAAPATMAPATTGPVTSQAAGTPGAAPTHPAAAPPAPAPAPSAQPAARGKSGTSPGQAKRPTPPAHP